jgi:hypothetical protein
LGIRKRKYFDFENEASAMVSIGIYMTISSAPRRLANRKREPRP